MSFFGLFQKADIQAGLRQFRQTPGAVLLDVRTREEYREGHIPGSMNLPLDLLHTAPGILPDKNTPIFLHCYSGARSRQAESILRKAGYTNLTDIGGIADYRGEREREDS